MNPRSNVQLPWNSAKDSAWALLMAIFTFLVTLNLLLKAIGEPALSCDPVRIEGVVTYDGKLPEPIPVSEAATTRQLIEVDPKTKGLKDAVVWLEGVPEPGAHPKVADQQVVMDQQNFFFVPHVLAITSGQAVEFRNSDIANHGTIASSMEPENRFNVVIQQGSHFTHRFVTSKRPVTIGCPIHVSMAGWIFVFDHRFHAVTDNLGRFALPPVPSGRYTLRVHHADGGLRKTRQITAEADKPLHLVIDFHDRERKVAR
jgi:plastocyanin